MTRAMRLSWTAALVSCFAIPAMAATTEPSAPQVFAPGVVSGPANEDSAAFSPDGKTVFFDRINWPNAAILVSHKVHGEWTKATIAPFSGQWLDHDPAMSPDGSFLVFTSNRPDTEGGKPIDAVMANGKVMPGFGGHLWRVDRKGEGWGTPVLLPGSVNRSTRTFAPSVAADGSVYFQRPGDDDDFRLFRSQYRDGRYQSPVPVLLGDAGAHKLDPAIAPDESFIVFDANFSGKDDPDRLYIAFREGDGWSKPEDLGPAINVRSPWGSHLGPDHRTLYFSSPRAVRIAYPRTAVQASEDLARMQSWDNGTDNIWFVSLAPIIDAHKPQAKR
jgi:WD40 repeat protein